MATELWDISGRVALITGGARGIGLETARRLAGRGMRVALLDIDGELAADEAERIGRTSAIGLGADVTDREAVELAIGETLDRFGGLDVVVANAGVAPPLTTMLTGDPDAFERTVEIDLLGVWRTVHAALPHVVASRGYVLAVASLYAAVNGVLSSSYAVSKAGVEQLARALRVELAPHGAAAGVAYFGFIDTRLVREAFASPVANNLRGAWPAWLSRPVSVARAGTAMVSGIERRAARVSTPWWVAWMLAMRGPLGRLDARLERHPEIVAAIRKAEAEAGRAPAGERSSS